MSLHLYFVFKCSVSLNEIKGLRDCQQSWDYGYMHGFLSITVAPEGSPPPMFGPESSKEVQSASHGQDGWDTSPFFLPEGQLRFTLDGWAVRDLT